MKNLWIVLANVIALVATSASAGEGGLTVELNKLEATNDGSCRAFFLFRNDANMTFEEFEMSLAVLDINGVIERLLSIDAAPLPVARTTLKLFEIPDLACPDISELLLHDIPACKAQNADPMDCFSILTLESRASARLVQ